MKLAASAEVENGSIVSSGKFIRDFEFSADPPERICERVESRRQTSAIFGAIVGFPLVLTVPGQVYLTRLWGLSIILHFLQSAALRRSGINYVGGHPLLCKPLHGFLPRTLIY